MPDFARLGIMAAIAGSASCGLPAVPVLGDKIDDYVYIYWISSPS